MDARRQSVLEVLGVTRYVARAPAGGAVAAAGAAAEAPPAAAALDWPALEAAVAGCTRCGLCRSRGRTVFGTGDRAARLMVVGEAPGAEEDRQGLPFVGRAGQLLTSMLRAMGLAREQVYIANVLKCRPPGNRDPAPAEAQQCRPYLERQIELVAPRLLLCVGRIAAQNLLGTDAALGSLRGRLHRVGGVPVVVTYHPAYLLRSPAQKPRAWEDLRLALDCLADGHGA